MWGGNGLQYRVVHSSVDGHSHSRGFQAFSLCMSFFTHAQVSRKGRSLHDKAVINCQFSMATFSTGERKRRPRGDK